MGRLDKIRNWSGLFEQARYSTKQVAGICDADPESIRRLFQRRCEATPFTYFNCQRMAKAIGLLREGRLKIKEIAFLCGYDHEQSFCRHFKRVFGVPASRFAQVNAAIARSLELEAERLRQILPATPFDVEARRAQAQGAGTKISKS